jgi:hypothetical protein
VNLPTCPANETAWPSSGAATAVRRLQAHFPPPRFAVGEAWFMGESRRYYATLRDPHRIRADNPELLTALEEIGSGQVSFGPMPEWTDWLHYLLSRLPELANDGRLDLVYEAAVTALMTRYPGGSAEPPYVEFFDDVLAAFGVDFVRSRWPALTIASLPDWERRIGAGGVFCAALCLTARYAKTGDLPDWWASVIATDTPRWRTRLLLWMASVSPLLTNADALPSDSGDSLPRFRNAYWQGVEWMECARAADGGAASYRPIIPRENAECLIASFRAQLDVETLLNWLVAIESAAMGDDDALTLQSELQDALEHCVAVYALPARATIRANR